MPEFSSKPYLDYSDAPPLVFSNPEIVQELRRRMVAAGFDNVDLLSDAEVVRVCADALHEAQATFANA